MGAFATDWAAVASLSRNPPRAPDANPVKHGSGWTGLSKRVWLLLYSEGGHWTAEEIRIRLQVDRPIWTALGEMVRSNFLVRHRGRNIDQELTVKYAVTRKCKVPRDIAVEEIEELLQLALSGRQP